MMKMSLKTLALGAAAVIISTAPGVHNAPALAGEGAAHHGGMGMSGDAAGDSSGMTVLSGKVIETMDSGGYTYMLLEKGGKQAWVAVPAMKVKAGEQVALQPGLAMPNFKSESLERTFEVIYFSPGPVTLPGTKADKQAKAAESSGKSGPAIKVEKAAGEGASTVGECYGDAAKLDKKTVRLRCKVVKVSEGIMGMNWVHVQDGTGDAARGTQNLVCTTDDLPAVGDEVDVTGTLAKDKDFGYGYKYDVIIEKAHITK